MPDMKSLREGYYYLLNARQKRKFRMEMCRILMIPDTALYRKMRLSCFSPLEWQFVEQYMERNPVSGSSDHVKADGQEIVNQILGNVPSCN